MASTSNTVNENHTHPLSGQSLSGAETIIQVLVDEGVDAVFGYSGGAILPTYDALFRYNRENDDKIRLTVPANEQGAGFMAAGYARATGKVGVAMVTSGPGGTNTVTPIRDSMGDSVPMVLLCGQVPRAAVGTDAFQEAPMSNIMNSAAKHVFLVTEPEKLEDTIRTAFEIARSGRPGPVVVDIPKDVQTWSGPYKGHGLLPVHGYRQRMLALRENKLDEAQSAKFFEFLEKSKRPLIYAGGGVNHSDSSADMRELAQAYGIPVVTTLMGLGTFDTTDALSMRMLGMHGAAFANYAVEDCDLLIAIGARFDDRVAGVPKKFAPNAKAILQLDADASEIGKVKNVDWSHVGLLKPALRQLLSYGREQGFKKDFSEWHKHCAALKKNHAMNYDRNSDLIQPYAVIEAINNITKGEAVISTGVGQHQMWAAQYFDFREPRLWLTSGSMGTMGFGLPSAIGAAVGRRDKQVIDIDGDASIRMNIGELETAATYNLPVKIVVFNNSGDGMVKQWQRLFFKGRLAASDKSLHKKDFIKAAEADGFEYAKRLSDKNKLESTIAEFLQFKGPAFLEVMIDTDAGVYPMVGPGKGYREMITGDFINSRYDEQGNLKEQS